jgi:transcriptional regulator with XRE-family HTH domain
MTVGERIREIRKELNVNQTVFGSKIGLKQAAIGLYENEQRTVSDRCISDICREFNVNEEWLRNGTGNMFVEPATFSLDDYARSNNLRDMEINLIRGFMELDHCTRDALYDLFKKAFATEHDEKNAYDDSPKSPDELEKAFPPVDLQGDKDTNVG